MINGCNALSIDWRFETLVGEYGLVLLESGPGPVADSWEHSNVPSGFI
jgi:hypothetical protein